MLALCFHQIIGDFFNGHWRDSRVLRALFQFWLDAMCRDFNHCWKSLVWGKYMRKSSPFWYTWTNKQRLKTTAAIAVSNRVYRIKSFQDLLRLFRFDCFYPGAECYSNNKTYLHFANFVWDGDPAVSLNRLTMEYHAHSYGNWELIP